jgi:hypothetical protein
MPSNELYEHCLERFNRHELIELCCCLANKVQAGHAQAQTMRIQYEGVLRMHTETMHTTNLLQKELRDKASLLDTKMQSLDQDRRLLERSDAGLRTAVIRQARQVVDLKNEINALQSEMRSETSSGHVRVEPITELVKQILEQMEEILTDPVSLDLFDDPLTLTSGHTLSRSTVRLILSRSREYNTFVCPMSRSLIFTTQRRINREPRSTTVANILEVYNNLKAGLENIEQTMQ